MTRALFRPPPIPYGKSRTMDDGGRSRTMVKRTMVKRTMVDDGQADDGQADDDGDEGYVQPRLEELYTYS